MNEYQILVDIYYALAIAICEVNEEEITDELHDMILGDAIKFAQKRCAGVRL